MHRTKRRVANAEGKRREIHRGNNMKQNRDGQGERKKKKKKRLGDKRKKGGPRKGRCQY